MVNCYGVGMSVYDAWWYDFVCNTGRLLKYGFNKYWIY